MHNKSKLVILVLLLLILMRIRKAGTFTGVYNYLITHPYLLSESPSIYYKRKPPERAGGFRLSSPEIIY